MCGGRRGMTEMRTPSFVISVEDFDRTLLPEDARDPKTDQFRTAVRSFFETEYRKLGGKTNVAIEEDEIQVSWEPERMLPEYVDQGIALLEKGKYEAGISVLRALLRFEPADPVILYNLGMAESDTGQLQEAERHLRQLLDRVPEHVNGLVALGVALNRQGRDTEAIEVLENAVALDPKNPYAQRNLGGCLLSSNKYERAERHLSRAAALQSRDARAWLGLGQAREAMDKTGHADEAYKRVIQLDPSGDAAEMARKARSRIAREEYQAKSQDAIRMDTVMYCLAAVERFESMDEDAVRQVTLEIALLGRSGLDVNNSEKTYTLSSLPGTYSGLELVCMMYVGFRALGLERDIGFDLSREYEAAQELQKSRKQR